jgi:hypothetical protein
MLMLVRYALGCTALVSMAALTPIAAAASIVLVPGASNPYLAGLPAGSSASGGMDTAPAQSPPQVLGLDLSPGATVTFSASGLTSYDPGELSTGPDGGFVFSRLAENGISGYTMTVNALVGVFLGPGQPDLTSAPPSLDFTTPASRDYLSLSPLLKQVFFIGDGLTSTHVVQQVITPAGTTRLFLGTADGLGWYNNTGSFTVTANATPVNSVPEPSSLFLSGIVCLVSLGIAGARHRRRRAPPTPNATHPSKGGRP